MHWREHLLRRVALARRHARIVADSEMTYAVWPDPNEADGAAIQIIEGEQRFRSELQAAAKARPA
jgi:hypothetical protein